jgi:S1/P1 Nuclease
MRMFLLSIAIITGLIYPALAWGPEGHQVIGAIAEKGLTPQARAQITEILMSEPSPDRRSLTAIANWADQVRPSRPETAPWHFVDIPVTENAYDPQRDCANADCVVARINEFTAKLADRSLLRAIRFEALKWVVHFVGDVHQPLHCSDNQDRGGNDVKVAFQGQTRKLHQVWDSGIIDAAADDHGDYASRLFAAITPAERDEWQRLTRPEDWANECFAIAKREIYGPLNLIGQPGPVTQPIVLSADYPDQMLPVVEQQLKRAGTRLSLTLNWALR